LTAIQDGVRERLRETLQTVLVDEIAKRGEAGPETREDDATIAPLSTPTISKNTRFALHAHKHNAFDLL